ncbi:MAG: 2-amino-4-hydroxy-6-hydroxymethyldihydropteridine diphosphokinase, partial [Muribaculaceae bacterium]|nr:2-amino-4-hydroxy-6-hydroxymethyldihydropteridine diphosphokinase [Muribaculaceae bacterium]
MIKAQLQLGSNANSRRQNLERAVEILAKDFRILKISAVVESQDVTGGPTIFVNQLLEIETDFTADELHLHCKQIEASFGHRTPIVTHME